ncbi:transglycosylase SLT domain-containing protein [Candidatus Magnetobacterium casensis]|uniref:Transglycosylase SLT domain-containing protein n=1 Tax=Candidatus Magnetobacterium casense TaxID=1455061 RepID=A0ABS6RX99_9BACT|nr:transglycosylase SLT domain-containing protein [Candidatus Magnetobacterium casensis]
MDPALVAIIICFESAWKRHDVGPLGEKGLMQIKPRPNYDPPTDPADNIEHGVKYLADKIRECGSVLTGLSAYQSGRCTPIIRQARYRYAVYERFKRYGTIRADKIGADM